MIEIIKQVVKNYISNLKPTRVVFGKIESVSPLVIRVNEKLLIPVELIIWPPTLISADINKKVLMLQQEGGQQFYILEVKT